MVTDSWTRARQLVARFLARSGADASAISGLDDARSRLLTTDAATDEQAVTMVSAQCQVHLRELVAARSITSGELHSLLASLQRLAAASVTPGGSVRNDINGGVQYGPVIQSGRITGLTFHTHPPPAPTRVEGGD
ncbi:hypothetical protein ACF090_11125 [Streptomyces sp. NPDC014892]|uniref:hypothetical protein n=1 Tax=Streptomyces sp. NPDC014892 TaxID=3364930 RepID=UPI0036FAD01E